MRRSRFGPRSDPIHRHAIPWFGPEEYARICQIVLDPRSFPFEYDRWRETAERDERYWKRRGELVVRVKIDPDELLAWCAERKVEPNRNAIETFAFERTVGTFFASKR
jgi:hypothetical protein